MRLRSRRCRSWRRAELRHALEPPAEAAFAARSDGASTAWRRLYDDTTTAISVPFDAGDGVEPHWARDGRALYFRNRRELLRVPVEAGAAFSAGPPESVAALQTEGNNPRTFAVAPDGRILLLQVLRSPTRGRMPVLVTGWGEVLARR